MSWFSVLQSCDTMVGLPFSITVSDAAMVSIAFFFFFFFFLKECNSVLSVTPSCGNRLVVRTDDASPTGGADQ